MSEKKTLLTSQEVCSIITVCGKSGVSVLKFGDLHVEFDKQIEPIAPEPQTGGPVPPPPPAPPAEIVDNVAKDSLVSDEIALREEQLLMMLIEDPHEAEKLILQGELADDGSTEEA